MARATVSAGLVLLLWIGVLFGQAVLASPGPYSPPFAIASLQARVHEVQPYWLPVGENVTARPVSWEDIGVVSRDSSLPSFLFLGRHDGVVILYEDSDSHAVVGCLPADKVFLASPPK